MLARSLTWIAARRGEWLVGLANVAGDGGVHAFILDTTVHPDERRQGLGIRLVRAAADESRARGAEWLHVDYEPHLEPFYERCGFRPTAAGLLRPRGRILLRSVADNEDQPVRRPRGACSSIPTARPMTLLR
ncbi:hypothetical protein FDG2_0661 [Candidatus Protofrankia californiensis]|uniref:N-acetyltransferase domain-containing protein n=1 Tax=Candidatus Protofrankia californiensis TaxID=1839754 RepID=A0A1C3NU31_9ACTN|nr:GNAT family N-acetyltransferase [Protofrankia symbiont of Coriaria ruscifolia]SBW18436.1 hypothetical protein FDG2_0661 [Candidatus Protofrankia californiensis]